MKRSIRSTLSRGFRLGVLALGTFLSGGAASGQTADDNMAFTARIYPYGITGITIINESRERIVGFTVTSGNPNVKFNRVYDGYVYGPSGRSAVPTLVAPDYVAFGDTVDTVRWSDITSFDRGDSMTFYVDTSPLYANTATTMWNNGTHPNAVITVFGENGGRGELTLSDTLYNTLYRNYYFYTENRPRKLTVNSFTDGSTGGQGFVSNFVVRVTNKNGVVIENRVNPSQNVVISYLSDGDKVDISAVAEVYRNADGQFIYDSTSIPSDPATLNPRERFVASGLSVNNSPLTGDPTQYRFDISADTVVDLRWDHQYALLLNHDFAATASDEQDPLGNPWAGPLASTAAGNPTPDTTKIHWITRGEEVIAQIDGQVLDFTRPGLDIRYVPKAYRAQGSARGVFRSSVIHTQNFVVGQAPPQRQQVNAFIMDGWGSIDYVWQIQFGVKINVDDPSRSALPRVFLVTPVNGQEVEIGSLEGTFWFDPNDEVKVASAANVAGPTSLALSGWVSGDGYYFSSSGDINSQDGSLINGGPTVLEGGPVGTWQPSFFDVNGRQYRGLSIPSLRRPARVVWTYGDQILTYEARLGEYVFQTNEEAIDAQPELAAIVRTEPSIIQLLGVSGNNQQVAATDMAVWDANARRLYPLVPGQFRAIWNKTDGSTLQVLVTVLPPAQPHYPHIAGTPPVQLDPDPNDTFIFKGLRYTENNAAITSGTQFSADAAGRSVLLFGEIKQIGRGDPKEFLRVRVVETKLWSDGIPAPSTAIIGRKITDSAADLAQLGTGYLMFESARYNPNVYDASRLDGLAARDLYDLGLLRSTLAQKVVVNPGLLPGPIIPVNLHPGALPSERLVVVWYYDPSLTDEILWPYTARVYQPRWPVNEAEGLGRIVIASQHGSESLSAQGNDQLVVGAVTNVSPNGTGGVITNVFPALTTYNPSRLQEVAVYVQNNRGLPGYNPNEEHGLMAASRRFAQVSPRPPAAYALRNNDLNIYNAASATEANQPPGYTSHPYVLVQFLDTADSEYKMRVYRVVKEDALIPDHRFANQGLVTIPDGQTQVPASPQLLNQEPRVLMEAGEPVIPFYPLGVVIGASPSPESFGVNIKTQSTYWEDHKGTSWAVSGGENAWFTFSIHYPMAPDFWWPENLSGRIYWDEDAEQKRAAFPNVGDSVAFMPANISPLKAIAPGSVVPAEVEANAQPNRILYKSDWPKVAPVLKAGETLTFAGGEYRADRPTSVVDDGNGGLQTIQTPGLPGVVGFAVGEVVFDALNPKGLTQLLPNSWTVRMGQVLEVRTVVLPIGKFPSELLPANGRTRVSGGKYIFNDLPASLQKRLRYDPLAQSIDPETGLTISGRLEFIGLLNDKDIGAATLTASPPAVYVLEPNILTESDLDELLTMVVADSPDWDAAVEELYHLTRNPAGLAEVNGLPTEGKYLVGLQPKVQRNVVTDKPLLVPIEPGSTVLVPDTDPNTPEAARQFGPGMALIPNAGFLDPTGTIPNPGGSPLPFPEVSWVTVAENNDPSMGGSPVTLHVIKVDRRERYRGAIKTVLSDNVFDENVVLRHTGDFGANADDLVFEWWYRPDDGSLNVPPPYLANPNSAGPWQLFPDLSGKQGLGRSEVLLKGNPNAPETLLADSWWFVRYRHRNDAANASNWNVPQPNGDPAVNFTWAGAGNNDPFNDFDLDGFADYRAQLSMGWIKRVLDAVNPYEARIRDFEGDSPSTISSMLQQFGPRFEGPVALNPAKNVIENVGLIELYETVLKRSRDLSIDLSNPVSTPAIANALQLASTRLSDFYMLLANEAYSDAADPTIGIGSGSVEYGALAPVVHSFQNQMSSLMEEELALLRGVDNFFARPVYNRLFWNFTKGEGEAAYAMNYNISDINADGFIDEDDAMALYPQGHGDAWGHYLTSLRKQYDLLRHPFFNWVSRSEFYNLMDIVIPVDFLDERKFAQIAAAKAKAGSETVSLTYREKFVEDPTAQWQGYTDVNPDRAWGVQEWARRAAQGAYFDWVVANALLPSEHPNGTLEGIQKVDRRSNEDIKVISANLNTIQRTFDDANSGLNPLRLARNVMPFDIIPEALDDRVFGRTYFDQMYDRALEALNNAVAVWDHANQSQNRLRQVANSEADFRNEVFQQDLAYRNQLIALFGRPYDGTVGAGKLYPAGYTGPDLALYMYVNVREITKDTVPGPSIGSSGFALFDENGNLTGGDFLSAFPRLVSTNTTVFMDNGSDLRSSFAASFAPDSSGNIAIKALDNYYAVDYTDLSDPRVPLDNFTQLMPVKASGYTFQAPVAWGSRPSVGELQMVINEMLQQEAEIARAIAAWDALTGEIIRTMRLANAQLITTETIRARNEAFIRAKYIINNTLKGIRGAKDIIEEAGSQVESTFEATAEFLPTTLPTAGLAISPGDALAPGRGATLLSKVVVKAGIGAGEIALRIAELVAEIALDVAENEVNLANEADEQLQAKRELLKSIEDLVGDEPSLRIAIFKEIEALRALSDRYRSLVAEGARLIDERAAFNKRVAAMTQLNRYQDMTFRVHRNHALETYHASMDLAARYTYLAAKAYDYETNLEANDPGSPSDLFGEIMRARGPGLVVDGVPHLSRGGLANVLAWLRINYDTLDGALGFDNPQTETGKISLRTELFRILPPGSVQPTGLSQFPGGGQDSDELWRQVLENARVDDLWKIPQYRYYARPFASDIDANGDAVAEPGLVFRFGTKIVAGKNVFGLPLSGGDHAYDPTLFATKIRSLGVWFTEYISDDVLNGLPQAPRVYLMPVGTDVMSIPNSPVPDKVRFWNIVDQQIPVPLAAATSSLESANWIPLLDSLNGRLGQTRRFSSFRAYHDAGSEVLVDEMVFDSRLVGRSVWNTEWMLIIPGLTLNSDPNEGLDRFIDQVKDIKLIFQTYGYSGN